MLPPLLHRPCTQAAKKGALKNSFNPNAVGALKVMDGIHADGRPVKLHLECTAKENRAPGTEGQQRYMLRIKAFNPGLGPTDFPQLVDALHSKHVKAAAAVAGDDDDDHGSDGSDDDAASKVLPKSTAVVRMGVDLAGSDDEEDGGIKAVREEAEQLPGAVPKGRARRTSFEMPHGAAPGDDNAARLSDRRFGEKPSIAFAAPKDEDQASQGSSADNSMSESSSAEGGLKVRECQAWQSWHTSHPWS